MDDEKDEREGFSVMKFADDADLSEAEIRSMAGERRSSFYDKDSSWPDAYYDPMAREDDEVITDIAMVLSACAAIKRLMDSVEQAACENADLSSKLRAAVTYREGGDEEPGAVCGIPAVIDFLRGIGDAVEGSEELARRLHAAVLRSVIGAYVSEEI